MKKVHVYHYFEELIDLPDDVYEEALAKAQEETPWNPYRLDSLVVTNWLDRNDAWSDVTDMYRGEILVLKPYFVN